MTLTLPAATLAGALSRIGAVVEKRTTIPILSCVLLDAPGDGSLTVTGTNLDMVASERIEGVEGELGSLAVGAAQLTSIAQRLGDTRATLTREGQGEVRIAAGRARATLNWLPAGDFSTWAPDAEGIAFTIECAALHTLVDRTAHAVSNDETRYYLMGHHLAFLDGDAGGRLRMVATDGHQFGMVEVPAPPGAEGLAALRSLIIPTAAMATIVRLADKVAAECVDLTISDRRISARAGAISFASKLIDGTYPDYLRVIPRIEDTEATIEVSCAALADAIAFLEPYCVESRGVTLEVEAGDLVLSKRDPSLGEAIQSVPAAVSGTPCILGANGRYLAATIRAAGSDTIRIHTRSPGDAILFSVPGDDTARFVVMPMRAGK